MNLEQKLLYLGIFGQEFEKSIFIFEINIFEFFEKQFFVRKGKTLVLGLKMSFLSIFGMEFENTIVIIEMSTLELVLFQIFVHECKCLYLGPKIPYLAFFWAGISVSTLEFA